MSTTPKLPRGALIEAHDAVGRIPGVRPDAARAAARAALEAALPVIERAARKEAARQILELDAEDHARHHGPDSRNVGPWNDMRTVLRKVSRGEPIPDLPLPSCRECGNSPEAAADHALHSQIGTARGSAS